MNILQTHIKNYLIFCKLQKCLDSKTIKSYKIDLTQFSQIIHEEYVSNISIDTLETFIGFLHQTYKPKTVKRKIATIKAFFHYLEYKNILSVNPFDKIQIKFREPVILPKTIPLNIIEQFLKTLYIQHTRAKSEYQKYKTLQNIAIIELLFSTGIRISELCSLKNCDVNLSNNTILIFGKGSKERILQIGNEEVVNILQKYKNFFLNKTKNSTYFFTSQSGHPISDQSIRRMIKKYSELAGIDLHITPHMFRHTFATSLLESDVDIRYIQEMLGHSSINITEIYTHVTVSKQKDILKNKHPRKNFKIQIK